jgi:cobalt/nickel transport system ATP-binding protein
VSPEPVIRASGLCFAYRDGPRVLHGIDFAVPTGQTVGLIGPNGAGKTTLFLCLAGVLEVQPGAISIAGLDPADAAQRRRIPGVAGVVFQDSDDQLIQSTVRDDVAFGPMNLGLPRDEVERRVADALKHVGLTGFEERVPFHLSGGEKRRAALAGVLAMRPQVLLLDEPTMFLDPRGRRELARFLAEIPATRLIATHDLEFVAQTCERVMLLDAGRLIADAPAREVLANAEWMDAHGLEVPHSLRRGPQADPGHEETRLPRMEGP